MIEYEHGPDNQSCVCTTDKMLCKIYIEREIGQYSFFKIRFENGNEPQVLSGRYTTIQAAQRDLENYLRDKPVSKRKRVKEYGDKREKERNAAKSDSEGS